jgi:uncharacterized protein (TIGR04222 family)
MILFDLSGPEFLGAWILGWAVVILAVYIMRAIVTRSRSRASAEELAAKLHPTEIGYMIGGIDRAVEAAIAGLHHRGQIELDPETNELRATGKAGDTVLRPDGVFRGVIVGGYLSRVEAHVLERLPATARDLCRNTESLEVVLRRKLEEQGLLVEDRSRAGHVLRSPAYLWTLVGVIKLFIGIARDKPVFFLVLLLFGAGFALWMIKAPRLTSLGTELQALLEQRYAALETTARTAPQQLDASDMTLAYGVFGYLVAPAALMLAMPSYQGAVLASTTSASSCGGGSSCGSSCGGGCGGGCGGCS